MQSATAQILYKYLTTPYKYNTNTKELQYKYGTNGTGGPSALLDKPTRRSSILLHAITIYTIHFQCQCNAVLQILITYKYDTSTMNTCTNTLKTHTSTIRITYKLHAIHANTRQIRDK